MLLQEVDGHIGDMRVTLRTATEPYLRVVQNFETADLRSAVGQVPAARPRGAIAGPAEKLAHIGNGGIRCHAVDQNTGLVRHTAGHQAGARWVVLCDSNGGTLAHEIAEIVEEVAKALPSSHIGIECLNDSGNAVAGSLAAVRAGVRMVHGTINGLGERCGNADLVSLIPTLVAKMGYETGVGRDDLHHLTRCSRLLDELLDRAPDEQGVSDAARRVEVMSTPGVSALQAAAARAGAPLGHDFCAISLSDLLTPRDDIVKRLHAAAEGDFVIAFYNPVSRRRRTLLAEARDILLGHRPEDTPVLLASSLGRPEENIRYRRLADLDVDDVDMLTVVLVGSSNSKLAQLGDGPRMYTPRGYARRIDGDLQDVGNRHLETETSE